MSPVKSLIVSLLLNHLFTEYCSTSPVQQSWPHSQPLCHDGYMFNNGMCTPINCPVTHFLRNNVCVLRIDVAQPAQCSPQCCQANCQTSCQQPCSIQTPYPVPVPAPAIPPIMYPPPILIPPAHPPAPQPPLVQPPSMHPPSEQPPAIQPPSMHPPTIQPPTVQPPSVQPIPATTTKTPTIIICPNGTILLNGACHLVFCGTGVYREGKCIITICPDGSVWNGQSCEVPGPYNSTSIIFSTNITNIVNQTHTNHIINYNNNITIDITESPSNINEVPFSPSIVIPPPPPPQVHFIPAPQPPMQVFPIPRPPPPSQIVVNPTLPLPPQQPQHCCTITTPNTCFWQDRYVCRSHSYQHCGPICFQGNLNLMPRQVKYLSESCIHSGCGLNQQPFYPDCSRCSANAMTTGSYCQTYCQRRSCESCRTYDLSRYCESYPEAIACRPEYGYAPTISGDFFTDE